MNKVLSVMILVSLVFSAGAEAKDMTKLGEALELWNTFVAGDCDDMDVLDKGHDKYTSFFNQHSVNDDSDLIEMNWIRRDLSEPYGELLDSTARIRRHEACPERVLEAITAITVIYQKASVGTYKHEYK